MSNNTTTCEAPLSLEQRIVARYASRVTDWRLSTVHPTTRWRYTRERQGLRALLREWHKRVGLFAFLFMGWLGASGILLNQSVSLGLDASRVDWSWLLGMYGLHAEAPKTGFSAGQHWLVPTIEKTVLDGKPLEEAIASPLGFLSLEQFGEPVLYVAAADRLVLLSSDGQLIEQVADFNLPVTSIRRVGVIPSTTGDQVVIQDLDAYASIDGFSWQELDTGTPVNWSQAIELPDEVKQVVLPHANPSIALSLIHI